MRAFNEEHQDVQGASEDCRPANFCTMRRGQGNDLEARTATEDDLSDDDSSEEEQSSQEGAFDEDDDLEGQYDQNSFCSDDDGKDGMIDHSGREHAIRTTIVDLIKEKFTNAGFQQFLAMLAWCIKCIISKAGRSGGDTDEKLEVVMEVVDSIQVDHGGHHLLAQLGQSTQSLAGGGTASSGASSAGGAAGGAGAGSAQTSAAVVSQMATQAAASAAGASSTAVTSTAAAITTTIAGAVASVGVASQVGMTVGIAAVAATAMSGGVVGIHNTTSANVTTATADLFVPPTCSFASQLKRGVVELTIQGLSEDALSQHQESLEVLFRDLYNNITGMCLDPFSRVLHSAELQSWSAEDRVVFLEDLMPDLANGTATNKTTPTPLIVPVVTTTWVATVACDGCPDHEPLFELPMEVEASLGSMNSSVVGMNHNNVTLLQANSTSTTSSSGNSSSVSNSSKLSGRHLQMQAYIDMTQFLHLLAASFSYKVDLELSEAFTSRNGGYESSAGPEQLDTTGSVQVIFAASMAASLDGDAGDLPREVVLAVDQEAIQSYIEAVVANGGIFMAPFISDDLSTLSLCVSHEQQETPEDQELCKMLRKLFTSGNSKEGVTIDYDALAACLETPADWSCQRVLAAALEAISTARANGIMDKSFEGFDSSDTAGFKIIIIETAETSSPVAEPSSAPSEAPSLAPTETPSLAPSETPSLAPSETPSSAPSETPSSAPSEVTASPSTGPSQPLDEGTSHAYERDWKQFWLPFF
ncbi:expressed unknown protein [Seminavis robusta]|uniref:Uncharacterized protein n=1 Tax=Seminavis robusta TaxID=568900 RepID=A0A9N8ES56_9STRA|nr:expressed unknown protein [Seminavis robusta]|eukprot:Sro1531_g280210.1 n/a (757) ;mRNA; f:23744-26292